MEHNIEAVHAPGHHHEPHHHPKHGHEVHFHVNDKPVHIEGHRHTGLEIKEAAIAQHVKIQLDFLLYLVRHHHPNQPIADKEEVEITDESCFHAIADDDNS